ncbi:MAG: thioredoxin family protein [Desulfotignum sp.]
MKTTDKEKISAWAKNQPHGQTIFVSHTHHREQEHFNAFARELSRLAPCITVQPSDKKASLPGIFVTDNILLSALPLEKELPPFLEALSCLAGSWPVLAQETQTMLDHLDHQSRLTLFIAMQCPHCPDMVRTLVPLAARSKKIFLHIIDGSLFPETAREHHVMSAPCLILDQDFRWTGHADPEEIVAMMLRPDPSQLGSKTLKHILEQGDAQWISRHMIEAGTLFDGFIALLLDSTWSVRLGAMVVVEILANEAPDLAAQLAPVLIHAFADKEIPVQGDMLYALGEVGTSETKIWIQKILPGLVHPDLVEAARDALAAIDEKLSDHPA